MRAAIWSIIPPCPRLSDWPAGLVLGVLFGLLGQPAFAEENTVDRTSRLGFKFDQQAHDSAAAAEEKRAAIFAESTPPDVVRLPTYEVKGKNWKEHAHEFLTEKGRAVAAEKQFESPMYRATIGPLMGAVAFVHNVLGGWNPNAPEALVLQADMEQKRRNREMSDLLDLAALADDAKRAAAKPKPKPGSSK